MTFQSKDTIEYHPIFVITQIKIMKSFLLLSSALLLFSFCTIAQATKKQL